jgi:hypothetical protein
MMADWKSVLGQIAPTAATLLGGPFAGLAVGTLVKALGISTEGKDPVATIQTALTTGQLSGDQILALKQAELDLQKHLADNGIQLEQISANDRDSARKREEVVKDHTPTVLAYLLTVGFFGTLSFMMLGEIPATGHDVLLIMIGSLGTAWTGMIAYYYGSSAGSKAKDDVIGKALGS